MVAISLFLASFFRGKQTKFPQEYANEIFAEIRKRNFRRNTATIFSFQL
jgi:hypothetical protein